MAAKSKPRAKRAVSRKTHEARRKKYVAAFRKAAKDLIELDSVPFAEFRTDIVARGETVTVVLRVEDAAS